MRPAWNGSKLTTATPACAYAHRPICLREPLHRLNQRPDPGQFVRIHRSAIVRIDRIAELGSLPNCDCLLRLKDGTPLRVSRTYIGQPRAALSV
jgi:two-component system LytT family response regulator